MDMILINAMWQFLEDRKTDGAYVSPCPCIWHPQACTSSPENHHPRPMIITDSSLSHRPIPQGSSPLTQTHHHTDLSPKTSGHLEPLPCSPIATDRSHKTTMTSDKRNTHAEKLGLPETHWNCNFTNGSEWSIAM